VLENPAFWILFSGYTIVWIGIGSYVFTINRRQRDVERELASLEAQARSKLD
jgi:CcmD family protein